MSCIKRCVLFLFCLLLAVAAAAAGGLYYAGGWLLHTDAPQKADAILVLGGDSSRALEAAELYKSGYAPVVYISAPVREPSLLLLDRIGVSWPREEDMTRKALRVQGVPEQAIRLLGRDMKSTAAEAAAAHAQLADKSLLIVTSPYHTRRTGIIFRHALPDARIQVASNRFENFPEAWWRDQQAARNVVLELVKLAYYLLGGRF